MTRLFISFIICFFLSSIAYAKTEFLPADQAFQVKGQILSPTTYELTFDIAPDYHLYSDSIVVRVISPSNAKIAPIILPQGIRGNDLTHSGPYMEYRKQLKIPLALTKGTTAGLGLEVKYQGCADKGLCYPLQTKKIYLSEISDDDLGELIADRDDANRIDHLLQQQKLWVVLGSFFIFGLLLAFTPCVFPMLPILSGIIAGQKHITSLRAFFLSCNYVFFSALTYAFAGIFAGLAGHHLQSMLQNDWVIAFSGVVFIILAMSLFGLYELQLPSRLQNKLTRFSNPKKQRPFLSVAIMGVFSTLIVSPCVSAPLVGALAYIGESGSPVLGGFALFIMGLGMGVPLLVVGTSAGKLLPKAGYWMDSIKKFFGILLIAMAIWLWSRILPAEIILALSGILAITCSIYFGALEPAKKGLVPHLWKALGIVCGIYGLCLIIGAVSGSSNILQPLDKFSSKLMKTAPVAVANTEFTQIKNLQELKDAIAKNKTTTMVDFYADWCVSCHEMQQKVFNDPRVKNYFKQHQINLLQVDLTVDDHDKEDVLKQYKVIAPPTMLFFNAQGKWLEDNTVVGEQSVENFLKFLEQADHT